MPDHIKTQVYLDIPVVDIDVFESEPGQCEPTTWLEATHMWHLSIYIDVHVSRRHRLLLKVKQFTAPTSAVSAGQGIPACDLRGSR